ncbi:DUF726 domain-containing protein [Halorussus gelatinilyticus]|uniref:DUF726 domain-containing protein n=1 Tax=Halorussus gelatinilyticus TaxID=2937524 RepID=A0A8U0IFG3_9EURY|nr:DUF726 domain-containing protein [Halorussus gelatinilyticus]UPV99816.1 DUF726 domain-containing protein [Halorussus gelatinilyticus]
MHGDQLTDGHTEWDYSTVGDILGYGSANPDEVLVSVHGWRVAPEDAPDHFATVKRSLRNNGYDHPVVGFSYDSDTSTDNWWPTTDIAERNGKKLANFLTDYRERTGARIRLVGHSVGGRVVPATLRALNGFGKSDFVKSATLLGAAADNDSVAVDGEFGDDIAAAAESVDNYWKDGDDVLNWPTRRPSSTPRSARRTARAPRPRTTTTTTWTTCPTTSRTTNPAMAVWPKSSRTSEFLIGDSRHLREATNPRPTALLGRRFTHDSHAIARRRTRWTNSLFSAVYLSRSSGWASARSRFRSS